VDAPLVFIGYGLHMPERGYDDLKGLDLKGKIAVVISGGPADLPGTEKASSRGQRVRFLTAAGAVGVIALTTPKQVEIPWARQKLLAPAPGMYLADAAMRSTPDGFFQASFDPEQSERLFKGSGHTFAELCALADASAAVPTFPLAVTLEGKIGARREQLTSPNLVAKIEGADPRLKTEYVAISAHLDHLGVGAPINGDRIYNGAMDDASGVAAVLDIASQLKSSKLKRSVLILIVTAEEKGLLGSHYYSRKPTVPKGSIVADLNFDMPLPLWPLKMVLAVGDGESTLGATAHAAAGPLGLTNSVDPLPDRNVFTRTDQYSFVTAGVPALAFKFGFKKDTPQFAIEHEWRANRYHAPSDDLNQPGVLPEEAVKLDDYVAAIAMLTANDPERPHWLETSAFKRFAERAED
jgi:Zn-dependent M28 family amino/carboxypeptidase